MPALAAAATPPVQSEQQLKRTAVAPETPAQSVSAPARSSSSAPAKVPQALPGGTLKFVLFLGMRPGPKSTTNPMCISNVMSVPGPTGWNGGNGGGATLESRNANIKARAIVESYYPDFLQKCRQTIDGAQAAYDEYRSGRRGRAAEHAFVNLRAR